MPRKHANVDWKLPEDPTGRLSSWEEVNRALLMDLRDGLNRIDVAIDLQNCYAKQILTVLKRMDRRMQVSMPLRRKS